MRKRTAVVFAGIALAVIAYWFLQSRSTRDERAAGDRRDARTATSDPTRRAWLALAELFPPSDRPLRPSAVIGLPLGALVAERAHF